MLGVPAGTSSGYGAVSKEVALAMAAGAVKSSRSKIAVAVSGFTGGAPPGEENGLVHVAVAHDTGRTYHREYHFGDVERDRGRDVAAGAALAMLKTALTAAERRGGLAGLAPRLPALLRRGRALGVRLAGTGRSVRPCVKRHGSPFAVGPNRTACRRRTPC